MDNQNMISCSHWGMHPGEDMKTYTNNLGSDVPQEWALYANLKACLESLQLQHPDDNTGAIKSAQESLKKLLIIANLEV